MQLLKTVEGLRCSLTQLSKAPSAVALGSPEKSVGLIPTMGALHAGHQSLIQKANQENDIVVVSIFVNPLQFGPQEDLAQYPRDLATDRQLCEASGVDLLFTPTSAALYGEEGLNPAALTQVVPPAQMTAVLCGPFRPGHFQGVATVVTKLLSIVQPDRAYFGRKDAQQLAILKRLVQDLNLPSQIVPCAIARAADGLAHSSRNQYLTAAARSQAAVLYRSLQAAAAAFAAGDRSGTVLIHTVRAELKTVPGLQIEYVELVHPETLVPLETIETAGLLAIAVYLDKTRLIDNITLRSRLPIVAIDGPAGAGKSTVARRVAQQLGLLYLDTGAMYRAVTWLTLQREIEPQDQVAIAELLADCQIQLSSLDAGDESAAPLQTRVWVNQQEVTQVIRSQAVTSQVSAVAAQPAVRAALLKRQHAYGEKGGIVMEGRDIGTQVFPQAELKVFLTASVHERARRRQLDLKAQNQPTIALESLERSIYERDRQDSERPVAPLRKAPDAIEVQTDGLSVEAVIQQIVQLYQERLNA
ncbi:MAG: bifunctional pantoate--beta-alanine ligase/(d)CMP kinase [Leptolyngbyaceae cyanobacterium SM1_1_3]|nr:bifunctional pantoate--beta-alanine ligase/(d)CMP kinase [Leptolyngbyaceae cyanobacterium SM1_1_3]NJN02849.1 bifunctional pantoate--beta-alanine ligase/(d)CMP kinase [Leptolyngbyaceae cyanobacterium RM1_1_2]